MSRKNPYQEKLNILQRLQATYHNRETVIEWTRYQRLPEEEKKAISDQWKEYYQAVRKTRSFEIYREISKAFKETNNPTIFSLMEENKDFLTGEHFLKLPSFKYDPVWLAQSWDVTQYERLTESINNLIQQALDAEDYQSVVKGSFQ